MTVPVTLNGDPAEVEGGETLAALLERLGVDPRRVVVELNGRIVRSAEHGATTLAEGDELEVLELVGGGA